MEKDFQKKLAAGMALVPGVHYHKIADLPLGPLLKAFGGDLKMRTAKKPYDCYALHHCMFFALELKQERGMSLGKNRVEDHQEAALLEVEAAGGVGLVVVNFQAKLSAKEAKARATEAIDVAFAAPISHLVAARDQLGRDSIPLSWWEAKAWPLERIGTTKWDPRQMLASGREWRMKTPL